LNGCYAAVFFVGFDADVDVAFLLAFPFSFAANSCLTVAEMARARAGCAFIEAKRRPFTGSSRLWQTVA